MYREWIVKLTDRARFSTICLHAGQEPDPSTGAIITPIYQTSTYVQEEFGKHKGYEYGRTQNPTRMALERNLAAIEARQGGLRVRVGHGGDRRDRHDAEVGRPRRRVGQHLRRHVPAVRQGADALRAVVHLRRHVEARRGRARDDAGDADAVRRDADQPGDADHRPARRGRSRPPPQRPARRRQHVREPLHPASDRVRRRPGDPQHDQVPQRPQRQHRRHRHRRARRRHRLAAVHPERRGRDPEPVRFLARAARHQDAGAADAAAQRQRPGARRVPERAPQGASASTTPGCRRIRSTSWRSARCAGSAGCSRSSSGRWTTRGGC